MKGWDKKLSPFSYLNAKSMLIDPSGDAPELTGHASVNEASPGQTGYYLGMARH